ncbi:DUF1634 domain-containing protein [Achromobacter aloeverae]|uniref:DUF1634 domain-containing protein n=2 Tax=Achromobacter aloeverae TaxID=1750518 RepID=A0A4Q1HLV7_9BURK|nr:DUF1634 domain-containing protein [Achromobacter aloeverae]
MPASTPASSSGIRGNREWIIARLLWYGTGVACVLIAAGLLVAAAPASIALAFPVTGHALMKAGVAVFILLPMARVALMLALFLRERDYTYAMIAALVLGIIAAGIVVGA